MLLIMVPLQGASQISNPLEALVRPVERVSDHSPSVADIHFADFEISRLSMSRHGPAPWKIPGRPSKFTYYSVQPRVYGEEAIATAKFEAVDEHGALITIIPVIRYTDPNGRPFFVGVMLIPDRPFRVVVSGQAVDGNHYRRIHKTLFVPTSEPEQWESLIPHITTPANAKKMRAFLVDAMRQEYLKVKEEFDKLPGGVIVMPRTRVSNVNYAPLLSPSGRPRGLRITYEVEFSEDGYYNPELRVFPDYRNEEWRGKVEMKVLNGSIEPQPSEESPQVRPHLLAYGAGYTYRGNTTYRFTAELIPDYVIQNEQKTKFCIYNQGFNYDSQTRSVWAGILASKTLTTYRLYIQNSDFHGLIANFYPQHVLYNTFVAEGARDCGPEPTIRF